MDLRLMISFRRSKWQIILIAGLILDFYPTFAHAVASETRPVLEIRSPRHDAGNHWQGDIVSHIFEVRNSGSGELRILSVRPG